jgi:hypothetical protein
MGLLKRGAVFRRLYTVRATNLHFLRGPSFERRAGVHAVLT